MPSKKAATKAKRTTKPKAPKSKAGRVVAVFVDGEQTEGKEATAASLSTPKGKLTRSRVTQNGVVTETWRTV